MHNICVNRLFRKWKCSLDVVINLTVWKFNSNREWSCVDFCHCGYIPARSCTCRHFFCSCQSRFRRLSLYCLTFSSPSKHHNLCNIYLKSESITGQPASKFVVITNRPGRYRTVIVLRTKVFAKAILERYSETMFTKTVRILRTGLKVLSM